MSTSPKNGYTNELTGHGPHRSMKEIFQSLADGLDGSEEADSYGSGEYLQAFEAEVAGLFGKESAVFLPSGTMTQQIALRMWSDRQHNYTVAMHPTAHPVFAEQSGFRFLHPMQRLQFGAPEFLRDRILTVKDFESLGQKPGVVLLELPYRPLGGQLPTWDDLLATRSWAQKQGIPMHMDGARIWQCRPFYQKSYAEIAAIFDSVYVSFYKDLGGLCGAMLLGAKDFIDEARVWQVRYGGRLRTQAPFVVSARLGLQRVLPQIDSWVRRAQEVAAVLSKYERISVQPDPPHVNFFQLFVRGDVEKLNQKHDELAGETGTSVFWGLRPTLVPGVGMAEIHCWENALQFDLGQLEPFMGKLLS